MTDTQQIIFTDFLVIRDIPLKYTDGTQAGFIEIGELLRGRKKNGKIAAYLTLWRKSILIEPEYLAELSPDEVSWLTSIQQRDRLKVFHGPMWKKKHNLIVGVQVSAYIEKDADFFDGTIIKIDGDSKYMDVLEEVSNCFLL